MVSHGQLTVYRDCHPVADGWYKKGGSQSIVEALTSVLAEAEGIDVVDLPPLYDTIDIDALTQLFEVHEGAAEAKAVLSFEYDTWNVFVRADGRIRVCDGTRATETAPVFEGEPV